MTFINSLDIDKPPGSTRVVVAMSGGVDSSVVAALLKREGYDVVGITLQLYDHGAATHRAGACCAGQDIRDARNVAAHLAIPHYVLDFEERFRERVIGPFSDAYAAGETPVPCVACNQHVKFADLFETARQIGADVLATGHYVASRPAGASGRALHRAHDCERDQSYFLFATTSRQLAQLRFPLGDLTKAQVRGLAREFRLPVAEKPDSQDLCFVPSGRYSALVERLRPEAARPGNIVALDGRVIGRHPGIIHFTVGQRRGLGICGGEPLYVVRLDAGNAEVVVGPREALATRRVVLRGVNWIGEGAIEEAVRAGLRLAVRVRSTRPPVPAHLCAASDGGVAVEFADDEMGVSAGQACVFYDSTAEGARVLGGGTIGRAVSAHALAAEPIIGSDRASGACGR